MFSALRGLYVKETENLSEELLNETTYFIHKHVLEGRGLWFTVK